jgi:putative membrane protein
MKLIIKIVISAFAVLASSSLLPGVHVDNFLSALIVALVLSLLNTVVKPILILFTIPITIFSFGLFLIVINACMILLTDKLVDGFSVDGFWWAVLFSVILSLVTWLLTKIGGGPEENRNRKEY